MEIPIGGDTSALEASFAKVIDAVDRMGAKIEASLMRSAAAIDRAAASMGKMAGGANRAATAAAGAGAASASASARLMGLVNTAGTVGQSLAGIAAGFDTLRRAGAALRSMDFAQRFMGWVRAAGGVRGALTSVGARLGALLRSPAFRTIAVGAVAAAAAIGGTVLAIRGVRAGLNLVRGVTERVFGGIVSRARQAASAVRGVTSAATSVITGGGGGGLLGPLSGLAGMIGAGGLLFVAVSQFKSAWAEAADFEQMQTNIEQFTGSAQKTSALLADMSAFGVKTPFELPDLGASLTKMLSVDLGDRSAKLVKDLGAISKSGETLMELSDALAKGKTGKFQTEQLNKFLDRGVNLKPHLTAITGLSGKALEKAIETGLAFDDVTAAIARMSEKGQMYYGMLDRQSATATGRISNLSDAWGALRRNFMMPILNAVKPIIMDLTSGLESMSGLATRVGENLARGIAGAYVLIKDGKALQLLVLGFNLAAQSATDTLTRGFRGAIAFLSNTLPPIFEMAVSKLQDPNFWEGIKALFEGIASTIAAAMAMGPDAMNGREAHEAAAASAFAAATQRLSRAGGVDFGQGLAEAISSGVSAAKEAARGPEISDLTEARRAWDRLFQGVSAKIDAHFARGAVPAPPVAKDPPPVINPETNAGVRQATMISTSLAKVGGGGFGILISEPMVNQQRQTNQLLGKNNGLIKQLIEVTGKKPAMGGATFR